MTNNSVKYINEHPANSNYFDTTLLKIDDDIEELQAPTQEMDSSAEQHYVNVVPIISFQLIQGKIITFKQLQAISIGREDRSRKIQPAFDLSDYQGHELGVSRYHAQISYYQSQFNIIDLGSTNGTKINGVRLMPNTLYPIKEKDLLSFAMLRVFVDTIDHVSV